MKTFDVVRITIYGDDEEDEALRQNNLKYPEIVQYVKGEEQTFVVDVKTRQWELAADFLSAKRVKRFKVEEYYD